MLAAVRRNAPSAETVNQVMIGRQLVARICAEETVESDAELALTFFDELKGDPTALLIGSYCEAVHIPAPAVGRTDQ